MNQVNVRADTELRDRAIEAVESFVAQYDYPVSRSQITHLRQIAANEPAFLIEYANHQQSRVSKQLASVTGTTKRHKLESEKAFWELIKTLCIGRPPTFSWSLLQAQELLLPTKLRISPLPSGAKLARTEQESRKQAIEKVKRWKQEWDKAHFPLFFNASAPLRVSISI